MGRILFIIKAYIDIFYLRIIYKIAESIILINILYNRNKTKLRRKCISFLYCKCCKFDIFKEFRRFFLDNISSYGTYISIRVSIISLFLFYNQQNRVVYVNIRHGK